MVTRNLSIPSSGIKTIGGGASQPPAATANPVMVTGTASGIIAPVFVAGGGAPSNSFVAPSQPPIFQPINGPVKITQLVPFVPAVPKTPDLDAMLNNSSWAAKNLWRIDGQNVALYNVGPYHGSYTVSDPGDAETGEYSTNLTLNNVLGNPNGFTRAGNGRLFVDLVSFNGKIYEVTAPQTLKSTLYQTIQDAVIANKPQEAKVVSPAEMIAMMKAQADAEKAAADAAAWAQKQADDAYAKAEADRLAQAEAIRTANYQLPKQLQPIQIQPPVQQIQQQTDGTNAIQPVFQTKPKAPIFGPGYQLDVPNTQGDSSLSSKLATERPPLVTKNPNGTVTVQPFVENHQALIMAALAAVGVGYFAYKYKGVAIGAVAGVVSFVGVSKVMSMKAGA